MHAELRIASKTADRDGSGLVTTKETVGRHIPLLSRERKKKDCDEETRRMAFENARPKMPSRCSPCFCVDRNFSNTTTTTNHQPPPASQIMRSPPSRWSYLPDSRADRKLRPKIGSRTAPYHHPGTLMITIDRRAQVRRQNRLCRRWRYLPVATSRNVDSGSANSVFQMDLRSKGFFLQQQNEDQPSKNTFVNAKQCIKFHPLKNPTLCHTALCRV